MSACIKRGCCTTEGLWNHDSESLHSNCYIDISSSPERGEKPYLPKVNNSWEIEIETDGSSFHPIGMWGANRSAKRVYCKLISFTQKAWPSKNGKIDNSKSPFFNIKISNKNYTIGLIRTMGNNQSFKQPRRGIGKGQAETMELRDTHPCCH